MTGSPTAVPEPIVVLGAPRSGTTMLAAALGVHPDCARAREARLVWRYGNDHRSDELTAVHATPQVVAHIRARFAEIVRSQEGGRRLVEKTPANSVRPWFVDAVFPEARYVHITRDGWGCVPSIRGFWTSRATGLDAKQRAKARRRLRESRLPQLGHYAGEVARRALPSLSRRPPLYGPRIAGLEDIVDEVGVVAASAAQWATCATRSAAFGREIGPERYLEVKLEQLDAQAFRSVLDFCRLPPRAEVVEAFAATYDPTLARRQASLTPGERRLVAPVVEPVNAWLGYTAAVVP
jgi:Sulfotransferase family